MTRSANRYDSYCAVSELGDKGLRLRVQETNHAYTDRWLQYDGVRPVLEGTLSGDTRSLRSGQALTTTAKYVWEGNSYYDPLLFAYEGGAWKHPMYDGLGSTRQLLDNANQTVTDEYVYEAFGNLMDSTGSTPNPYKYVGSLGYYGTGSSLMHLGARYYLPEIGRFVQRDPVSEDQNLYVYAGNRPVLWVDASGELKCTMSFDGCQLCIAARDQGEENPAARSCWPAISGNRKPEDQSVRDVGPIPEGWWSFPANGYRAMDEKEFPGYYPGGYRLSAEPGTKTHHRGAFWIHGGTREHAYPNTTLGCIRLKEEHILRLKAFVDEHCTGKVRLHVDY